MVMSLYDCSFCVRNIWNSHIMHQPSGERTNVVIVEVTERAAQLLKTYKVVLPLCAECKRKE